jgi:hypothetical protein
MYEATSFPPSGLCLCYSGRNTGQALYIPAYIVSLVAISHQGGDLLSALQKLYVRWSNPVSTVSDYRLDDRGSIPGRCEGCFL